jgi:dienelactone hydrolase
MDMRKSLRRPTLGLIILSTLAALGAAEPESNSQAPRSIEAADQPAKAALMLVDYFERMSVPHPFLARSGAEFQRHQLELRQHLLQCIGLSPLPERVSLDARMTQPLDHPWCTVRRVYYQLWPGVYASGLLYSPKELREKPAPAMLCPHGHWVRGNADPVVQARCLVFARNGYVTFSPTQNHYEDLNIGVSHQTVGVWSNMRALDFLESLPEVDRQRIGVCGESGGGLQTEMLTALDSRVKAATIVGLTCDFREILFPFQAHCGCNHFPAVLRFADHPEISALGLPAPVLYLTMNDWTRNFARDSFPAVARLYAANGYAERAQCGYEPTEHTYDRSKREQTYAWMDRWLRSSQVPSLETEPASIQYFAPETLQGLRISELKDDDFSGVGRFYRSRYHYADRVIADVPRDSSITPQTASVPASAAPATTRQSGFSGILAGTGSPASNQGRRYTTPTSWQSYRQSKIETLKQLLGDDLRLPTVGGLVPAFTQRTEAGLVVERGAFPGEAMIRVPCVVIHPSDPQGRWPVVVVCNQTGKDKALENHGPGSPFDLARQGFLVALPDIRFIGELSPEVTAGEVGPALMSFKPATMLTPSADKASNVAGQRTAWERNAIVWGRPLAGMACTDLRAVLDGLAARPDADLRKVKITSRDSAAVGMGALFAAVLDPRVTAIDIDLQGCSYEANSLPAIPFILRHGDVRQWAAVLADRQVTIHHLSAQAGDPAWLKAVFAAANNRDGVQILAD